MDISPHAWFPVEVTLQRAVENQKICGAICALELPLLLLLTKGSQWGCISDMLEGGVSEVISFLLGGIVTKGDPMTRYTEFVKVAQG